MFAVPDGPLGCGDLGHGAADVDSTSPGARRRPPRNRPSQRPIDLEHSRPVAEALQAPSVAVGQPVAGHPDDLPRRQVQQDGPRRRQFIQRFHPPAGDDLTAQRAQVRNQRITDALRSAAGHRPADRVPGGCQHQRRGGARGLVQRQDRMAAMTRE
jgi:hypothetical protein